MTRGRHLLSSKRDLRMLFMRRAWVGFALIVILIGVLAGRFFWLQVIHYEDYATKAHNNRIRVKVVPPPRGRIYDRNGKRLAYNLPAYRLEVIPERVTDMDAMLARLRKIIPLSDAEISAFKRRLPQYRVFDEVTLQREVNESMVDRFVVNRWRFPGVDISPYLKRYYPYANAFAHVIGYVGRINKQELESVDKSLYKGTEYYGKSGIERFYEDVLHGTPGYEMEEVNVDQRVVSMQQYHPPAAGADIHLTLDVDIQEAAIDALGDMSGSVVAIDPRNGDVLAMVSRPSFDPNLFVRGISQKAYSVLLNDPDNPLLHRAIRGRYPPGSTIKPFIGLGGLELGYRTPSDRTLSTGVFHIPGYSRGFRDDQRWGAGRVNVVDAIAKSVNTYFYKLALDMGIDNLSQWMARFGFGAATGIDLYGEGTGILPSREWKRAHRQQAWFPGETVIAGIGQGYWVVTPLQLAHAVATLANRGVAYKPHLLKSKDTDHLPGLHPSHSIEQKDPKNWQAVNQGMLQVVYGGAGSTARGMGKGFAFKVAGKTGTAERFSRTTDAYEDHSDLSRLANRHRALFVAYTPADDPRIAVAVVVDHGAWGGSTAGPVARRVLDAWVKTEPAKALLEDAEGDEL